MSEVPKTKAFKYIVFKIRNHFKKKFSLDFSVFFQEIFDIFLPSPVADTAEVDTTSARHFWSSNIYSTLKNDRIIV